jgi:hypothetical protein
VVAFFKKVASEHRVSVGFLAVLAGKKHQPGTSSVPKTNDRGAEIAGKKQVNIAQRLRETRLNREQRVRVFWPLASGERVQVLGARLYQRQAFQVTETGADFLETTRRARASARKVHLNRERRVGALGRSRVASWCKS